MYWLVCVSVFDPSPGKYETPDERLVAVRAGQMQGRTHGRVLDARVNVHLNGEQEQHALFVALLYRRVEEVVALAVKLKRNADHATFRPAQHSNRLKNLFLPVIITCSAATGSLSSIDWAALLFLNVRAVAKGLSPILSRRLKSMLGTQSSSDIIPECWFSIATWIGVFPSASRELIFAPCSTKVWRIMALKICVKKMRKVQPGPRCRGPTGSRGVTGSPCPWPRRSLRRFCREVGGSRGRSRTGLRISLPSRCSRLWL